MVEANGVGIGVPEEQGRAVLMFLVVEYGQDALVFQRLDDLELTSRRSFEALAVFFGSRLGDRVLPHPPVNILERRMLGEAILITRAVEQQIAENVIADSTGPLRWANARLFHRTREGLSHPNIDGATRIGVDARPDATRQGRKNALSIIRILEQDPIASDAGQIALDIVSGEEHEGIEPRQPHLVAGRLDLQN